MRVVATALLLLASVYVFIGPFPDSPFACLRAFPASGPVDRFVACVTTPSVAPSFIVGSAFALLLAGVGIAIALSDRVRKGG